MAVVGTEMQFKNQNMPCVLLVRDHYYLLLLDASKKSSCTHFLPYYQKREMKLMLELFLSTVYLCYSADFLEQLPL